VSNARFSVSVDRWLVYSDRRAVAGCGEIADLGGQRVATVQGDAAVQLPLPADALRRGRAVEDDDGAPASATSTVPVWSARLVGRTARCDATVGAVVSSVNTTAALVLPPAVSLATML